MFDSTLFFLSPSCTFFTVADMFVPCALSTCLLFSPFAFFFRLWRAVLRLNHIAYHSSRNYYYYTRRVPWPCYSTTFIDTKLLLNPIVCPCFESFLSTNELSLCLRRLSSFTDLDGKVASLQIKTEAHVWQNTFSFSQGSSRS